MVRTNRYAGTCQCGTIVAAGRGFLVTTPSGQRVRCRSCQFPDAIRAIPMRPRRRRF